MVELYFSKKHYPQMLSVPLKGAYLQEFVALCKENLEGIRKEALAENTPVKARTLMLDAIAIQEKVIERVVQGLSSEAAGKYGIDANDLKASIFRHAHVDSTQAHAEDSLEKLYKEAGYIESESDQQKMLGSVTQVIADYAINAMMGSFSACLAVQEHKEKEYIDICNQEMPAFFDALKRMTPDSSVLDDQDREQENFKMGNVLLSSMQKLAEYKKDNRLTSPLMHALTFGEKTSEFDGALGELRKIFAHINGLDVTKAGDREKLRRIEKTSLQAAAEKQGVTLPPMPELS